MANASAEKLKNLALRHGEKAVMAIASVLCLLLLFMAVSQKTIETTPEAIQKAASSAESNLAAKQNPEDILKKLEEANIKNPNFEKMVDEQSKNQLVAANYKVANPWVTNEPGAGLIRDTPELIAVTDVYAYPGRGSALLFALNEDGERIPDTTKDVADVPNNPRRRRSRRPAGGMGMMGQMGARRRRPGMSAAQREAAAQKEYEFEKKRKEGLLAGSEKEAPEEKDKEAEKVEGDEGQKGPFQEVNKGVRWVVMTGVLDYKKLRDNYLRALKRPEVAYPHFKQLEVQRQVLQPGGQWSDWADVDYDRNSEILNNLPEEEEELTPDDVRIDALVDPLPFLKAGYWERVHVASLVPKEKKEVAKPMLGNDDGMMGMMGKMGRMQPPQMPGQDMGAMAGRGMPGMMGRMGGEMMGMGMGSLGAAEKIDFETSEADTLMVRSLDFSIDPDQTYRFRIRIVVFNPNRGREDISPGVDSKSLVLNGPWSEPTNDVTMPADVAAYAMHKSPGPGRRAEQVQFQVTRWTPEDGITVVKPFDAGPGDIIGETTSVPVPVIDPKPGADTKPKSKPVDFDSHTLVLDTSGGNQSIPRDLGVPGRLDEPAVSLLFQPDGTVVVRTQANDLQDEVRKTIATNYRRELDESGKKRESSLGSAAGARSMMGGGARAGAR